MNKDLNVSNLILIYGADIDERTRAILQAHYDHDMSLAEISEEFGITRQGVRDIIIRNTDNLYRLEKSLKLQEKFGTIRDNCNKLLDYTDDCNIKKYIDNIIEILDKE